MKTILLPAYTFFIFLLNFSSSVAQYDSTKKSTHFKITKNKPGDFNVIDLKDEKDNEETDSIIKSVSETNNLLRFTNSWKVKEGDDSSWATEDFNDICWNELRKDTAKKHDVSGGIFWYRMHFQIDSSLMDVPLALYIKQFGSATDVYLDGKFLKSFGKVGKDKQSEVAEFSINPTPFAFVFSKKKDHVFAIRYSDFNRAKARSKGFNLGINFTVSAKYLNKEISHIADPSRYFPFIFLAAVFITLAVVHFVMFIYYRQKITNLYYSLYCSGIFLIVFYVYYIFTSTDYASITILSETARYIAPLLVIPLVAMLHTIFYERLLKIFWIIIILYIISLASIILSFNKAATIIVVILFMVSIVEIIRVIIRALVKKKDGALIFALAVLLAPILGILSSFLPDNLSISGLKIHVNTGYIVLYSFFLGLPFSMTLYLARDFSRISKKLKLQLKEITGLSDKAIQQEKEKKQILENQKTELEIKVVERTQEVWNQKEVIEIKNKEITESLVYAKRIQSAILPDIKLIYKTLEQSFILYLPKDIVSGDFYGFAQKSNLVIIAAADCTGHGVAGAFMSMIGCSLLNQIINEKNCTDPASILDQLNEGIIHSLKQKEGDSNDGMDISICAFDLVNQRVHFAGANRPLWLIRNNELRVYKPNKFPIGGLQIIHEEKFTQQTIQLQKNDTLYIFSDGFADQFGGERGKKLMTKKFKDALLSIQNLSMHEQESYLHNLFQVWKGRNEQVDDVLVIGIRI